MNVSFEEFYYYVRVQVSGCSCSRYCKILDLTLFVFKFNFYAAWYNTMAPRIFGNVFPLFHIYHGLLQKTRAVLAQGSQGDFQK
jgi:hypothetical protein